MNYFNKNKNIIFLLILLIIVGIIFYYNITNIENYSNYEEYYKARGISIDASGSKMKTDPLSTLKDTSGTIIGGFFCNTYNLLGEFQCQALDVSGNELTNVSFLDLSSTKLSTIGGAPVTWFPLDAYGTPVDPTAAFDISDALLENTTDNLNTFNSIITSLANYITYKKTSHALNATANISPYYYSFEYAMNLPTDPLINPVNSIQPAINPYISPLMAQNMGYNYLDPNYINSYADPTYADYTYADPIYADPTYAYPSYAYPSCVYPTYADPDYADPDYDKPIHKEPEYEEPRHKKHIYEEPEYEESEYEEPEYEEPRHKKHAYEEPVFGYPTNPYSLYKEDKEDKEDKEYTDKWSEYDNSLFTKVNDIWNDIRWR